MSDLRGTGDDFRPLFALGEPPLRYRLFTKFIFGLSEYSEPLRGKIAAVTQIDLSSRGAERWRCAVMTMRRVTEVRRPKERMELGVPTTGLEQTAGVAEERSDREFDVGGKSISRPAFALSRRQTRSERSGWTTAGVESEQRRTAYRGLGLGV